MASWYVAHSLDILLGQINALAPKRSKLSDGSIGDAAHSARYSDHNPTTSGQVCARDFTNDPDGGLDAQWLANRLVEQRDPRIKYIISRGRIIDSRPGKNPWKWMPYNGINAHKQHVHVSVFAGTAGDSTALWNLGPVGTPNPPVPPRLNGRLMMTEDNMPTLPPAMTTTTEVLAVPPDADVKLIFAAKTTIFGGHLYNWSAVPGQGTGGDPRQWRTEVQEGEVIPIPRGTSKVHVEYSCASSVSVFIQAIS
ncbi:hypothetical protein [Amycolatopsis sp. BJA-103]|uniref:hypothetical protein n=1 Tax=Amycolatopsis sp. BJA-103 TaxID=1911175 RepID=UPI000C76D6EE|nr:hypothetical protein [Amycolatopsis sp. BJA-103]AUI56784.1 hypothetical protein BKN51_00195 [Amycolatopsis sp. BJA-103]PNE13105.1 hypothetical protein B1H26_42335 [Amycolatopsis sp. BJA-103]